jgi:hypothetical protein
MKSKIALLLFALSAGFSAAQAADPPDNLCYKIYHQCEADPAYWGTGVCYDELVACLNNP